MEKGIIYIIIAILLLVILVNLNVKELFTTEFTTNNSTEFNNTYSIGLNETKQFILNNLTSYKNNYLLDFNRIFDASFNVDPHNIYGDNDNINHTFTSSTNQVLNINKFDNYINAYNTKPQNTVVPTVPGMKMVVNHIIDVSRSNSYIAIQNIDTYITNIINYFDSTLVFKNYVNESIIDIDKPYTIKDIEYYKMILLTRSSIIGLLDNYNKLNIALLPSPNNNDNIYTVTTENNLITKHDVIILSIRTILLQIPILLFVCYPYFNGSASSDITDNIKLLDINNRDTFNLYNTGQIFSTALTNNTPSYYNGQYDTLFYKYTGTDSTTVTDSTTETSATFN